MRQIVGQRTARGNWSLFPLLTWKRSRGWPSRVEDNGPGIPSELLPDIFGAFVTSRLDARGTGLGLTVTEGIVTQHGGTISASTGLGVAPGWKFGSQAMRPQVPARTSRPFTDPPEENS